MEYSGNLSIPTVHIGQIVSARGRSGNQWNVKQYITIWVVVISVLMVWGCASQNINSQRGWQMRTGGEREYKVAHDNNLVFVSAEEKVRQFENAGPVQPVLDVPRMIQARKPSGVYRVVPGDVLEFQMPAILREVTPNLVNSLGDVDHYLTRVSEDGTIIIPIVGQLQAAGKSLSEIEALILEAYYPKYVTHPPTVVGKVMEYRSARLTIVGAVNKPGIYECHSNEMTLVNLIMKAGGIVDKGAAVIRIRRGSQANNNKPLVLPVKGLNIPFADPELRDGDTVEVEQLNPQVFTVIGLVNQSGTFPYPPGVRYNLLQALAFAGGVNDTAAPSYARVYRQTSDGRIISGSFRLKGTRPMDAANLTIKPGDVVAVEHTVSTQTRLLLAQIFRVGVGFNAAYWMNGKNDGW